jgi:phosphate transport system substrate-binding protein
MKKVKLMFVIITVAFLAAWAASPAAAESGEKSLKIYSSNQVYKAFDREQVQAFSNATGIEVKVKTASSGSSVHALMGGYCDIASTARAMYRRHQDYGFLQFPFCRDPIAVIVNEKCGVDNLSELQLQEIFSGSVSNWNQVGGPDLEITVIVPSTETAANKNFRRQVMKDKDIEYDFMAHDSTMAIAAVAHFPCGAVSFISRGASSHEKAVKVINIDGKSPTDKDYPYFQTFYYVTRAEQSDAVKQFLDFAFSDEAKSIIRQKGMIPLAR